MFTRRRLENLTIFSGLLLFSYVLYNLTRLPFFPAYNSFINLSFKYFLHSVVFVGVTYATIKFFINLFPKHSDKALKIGFVSALVIAIASELIQIWLKERIFSITELLFNVFGFIYGAGIIFQARIKESEEWFSTTLKSIDEGVVAVDRSGHIQFLNQHALLLMGVERHEVINQPISTMLNFHDEITGQRLFQNFDINQLDTAIKDSCLLIRDVGDKIHVEKSIAQIRTQRRRVLGAVIVFKDITERKLMEKKLQQLAVQDKLSGLYNRIGFSILARDHINNAQRNHNKLMLLYLDLNNMKQINDTYGHSEGDKLLKMTGKILKKSFRKSDILARLGGDEFVVLATLDSDCHQDNLLYRLYDNVNLFNQETDHYDLSISLGISIYNPDQPLSLEDLISEADKRMYEHKREHKRQMLQQAKQKKQSEKSHKSH